MFAMRFAAQGLLSLAALSVATGGAARATNTYQLHSRGSTDTCGDVNGSLKVNFLGKDVIVGPLS